MENQFSASKKTRENWHVSVPVKILTHKELSEPAKILLIYLHSNSADWVFYSDVLQKELGMGREKFNAAVKNLETLGFVKRTQKRLESGKFSTYLYEFSYEPEFKICLPETGFPSTVRTAAVKPAPKDKKEESKDKKSSSSGPPDLPPTKEEEEEISRRLKERPSDAPKIVVVKKWREQVLKDIRNQNQQKVASLGMAQRHMAQAAKFDMSVSKKYAGSRVFACKDGVEFIEGSFYKKVMYDINSEEWSSETGFED